MNCAKIAKTAMLSSAICAYTSVSTALEVVCPESIEVVQAIRGAAEGSWTPSDIAANHVHHFYAVSFSESPPGNRVYLSSSTTNSSKDAKSETDAFSGNIKDPVWIICQYLETSMVSAGPLNEPHRSFSVYFSPLTDIASVKRVDCR